MSSSKSKAPPETAQEAALAEVTMKGWRHWEQNLRPFEDKWLAGLRMTDADQARITGQTAAGLGSHFDRMRTEQNRGLFARGVDPGSGRFVGAQLGLGADRGTTTAAATTRAGQAVDDKTVQNLQQAIRLGRGEATEATRDLTSLASDAASEAISNTYRRQDERDTVGATAMGAAGMGLGAWSPHPGPRIGGLT